MSVRDIWARLTGRQTAAILLVAAAAVSVALACLGDRGALAAMRGPAAVGALAAFALLALLACWRRPTGRARTALLFHVGFALVVFGWVYNRYAGPEDGYLQLRRGQTGAVDDAFTLAVRDFRIERYPGSQTVSQYRCDAEVEVAGEGRETVEISVNHPLVKKGWWVYQSSYQEAENPHTGEPFYFTILECVKDVGLPYAGAGGVLLLLGALLLAARELRARTAAPALPPAGGGRTACRCLYALAFAAALCGVVLRGVVTGHAPMQNMYEFLLCTLVLLPLLTLLSAWRDREDTLAVDAALMALVAVPVLFFMDGQVKKLMPALQSPFFVPHVGAYVLGYVLLVRAALGAGRRLVGAGFFLLTLGLVLGAAWGKVCWGHWWQFDPKEMWSLATWFVYLAYFHLAPRLSARGRNLFLAAGAVMIVLTLTWINLSRLFTGMHSYA